jgi:hypothetical protein
LALTLTLTLMLVTPAGANTIHVPGDFPTIGEAINAALPGDVILVAPGTYTGPPNASLNFAGKDIELRSTHGSDVTIITGNSSSPAFFFHSGESPSALIDGFTITEGYYPIGGIHCRGGSSPTIRNCVLSWHNFGAMTCNNASPSIENCTFSDNARFNSTEGAGLLCINDSRPRIINCTFLRNNARAGMHGGGIRSASSSPIIYGCIFKENGGEGGGGIAGYQSTLMIIDCHFENNDSDNYGGSGIFYEYSSVTIMMSRFYNNRGRSPGVALGGWGSTVSIENCTFVGNDCAFPGCSQIGGGGGGIFQNHLAIENTIVAFSSGKAVGCGLNNGGGSNITLECCDLFGNQEGDWNDCILGQLGVNGNFAADPRFCDLLAGDLTLNEDSPCMPGNHPQGDQCGLIGAVGGGCGVTTVHGATWGRIKAEFLR